MSEKHLEEPAAKQFLNKRNLERTARDWCTGIGTEFLEEKRQRRHKDENSAMEKADL